MKTYHIVGVILLTLGCSIGICNIYISANIFYGEADPNYAGQLSEAIASVAFLDSLRSTRGDQNKIDTLTKTTISTGKCSSFSGLKALFQDLDSTQVKDSTHFANLSFEISWYLIELGEVEVLEAFWKAIAPPENTLLKANQLLLSRIADVFYKEDQRNMLQAIRNYYKERHIPFALLYDSSGKPALEVQHLKKESKLTAILLLLIGLITMTTPILIVLYKSNERNKALVKNYYRMIHKSEDHLFIANSSLIKREQQSVFPNIKESTSALDKQFLERLTRLIEEHMEQGRLDNQTMAQALMVSRSILYNKVKSLTGVSPTMFQRKFRLYKAKELLSEKMDSISIIANRVGYTNSSQFSKIFKEEFGVTPSAIRQAKRA